MRFTKIVKQNTKMDFFEMSEYIMRVLLIIALFFSFLPSIVGAEDSLTNTTKDSGSPNKFVEYWQSVQEKEVKVLSCFGYGCCLWKGKKLLHCGLQASDNNEAASGEIPRSLYGLFDAPITTHCSGTCCCTWKGDTLIRCVGDCGPSTGYQYPEPEDCDLCH